jgi:hypothetical protein
LAALTPEAYNESCRKEPKDEVLTFILHLPFVLFWGFGSRIAERDFVSGSVDLFWRTISTRLQLS